MKEELFFLESSTVPETGAVSAPDGIIALNEAVNYYNNFHNTRVLVDGNDTTRKVWFDLKILEAYLETVNKVCIDKNIDVTGFTFLLGADKSEKRTVFLAPMCYDQQMDMDRAFTIFDGEVVFLHGHYISDHSSVVDFKGMTDKKESLILGESGTLSISEAVSLYNNYYDAKIKPFSNIVEADTRVVYYRKKDFEQYLDYLSTYSKANNVEVSGINAVFSAYDNDRSSYDDFANHLTLFFAPTINDGIENESFFSFDAINDSLLDFSKAIWENVPDKLGKNLVSSLFNHGSSGPPPNQWD